jgi:hypothetical protein
MRKPDDFGRRLARFGRIEMVCCRAGQIGCWEDNGDQRADVNIQAELGPGGSLWVDVLYPVNRLILKL